jgi:hypothetical protein
LGCAAGLEHLAGVHGFPRQSVHRRGFCFVIPSHHTPPSSVSATLLKMVSLKMVAMAMGLLAMLVPGATPKNPFSGLIALSWPRRQVA